MMDSPGGEVKSDKLLGMSLVCPQCGSAMQSTGKMQYSPIIKEWLIEYWCPRDRQLFHIYTPEAYSLARDVASESKTDR